MSGSVRVEEASWHDPAQREILLGIRREVFIEEQQVPEEIEVDEVDPVCRHLLAFAPGGRPIGTARMRRDGHVGRIAVVRDWRGRGVGARLVRELIALARHAGLRTVDLDSQTQAIGFYEKLDFEARGEVFMEAGIRHQNMVRILEATDRDPDVRRSGGAPPLSGAT